ncbi:MAG: DUF4358 domain-containing protein [Oscillospiraceae bacterium]
MKKLISALLVLTLSLLVTACGQKVITIDSKKLTTDLLENVKYEDKLEAVDSAIIKVLYDIESDDVKASGFIGSGATAEEIALFEAPDESKAKDILDKAHKHIEKQKEDFKSYNPKELKKLDNAVTLQKGKYVIVCVSNGDNAEKIVEKHLN